MPFFKINLVYKLFDNGWTETYYTNSVNAGTAVALTDAQLQRLIQPRNPSVILQSIRSIEEGGVRRGVIRTLNLISTRGVVSNADIAQASAKFKLNSNEGHKRQLEVRGLDDDDLKRYPDGSWKPSALFMNLMAGYFQTVMEREWQIRFFSTQPWKTVVSLQPVPTNDNQTRVTVINGENNLFIGDQVRFRRFDPCIFHNFRAPFTVVNSAATFFDIPFKWRFKEALVSPGSMQWAKVGYDYEAIAQWGFFKFGSRDTGRPFDLSRGRQRGMSCRR